MEQIKNLVGSLAEITKKFQDAIGGLMNPGGDAACHGHFASLAFQGAANEERPTRVSESHVEEELFPSVFEEERPTRVNESHVEEEHFPSVFEVGESSTRPLDDDKEDEEDKDEEMEDLNFEEEPVISKSYKNQLNKMPRHYQTRSTTRTGTGTSYEMEDLNRPRTTTGTGMEGLNTEEEPTVEPESKNGWNAFLAQQKKKAKKDSEKYSARDSATIWNGMSPDEKLKYGKKKKKVKLVVQCSTNKFFDPLKKLDPERLRMLEDSPFHKLLGMKHVVQNNKGIKKLAAMFNTEERCLEIEGVKYVVTPDDFSQIMGVDDGEEEEIKMPGRGAKKKSPNEAENKLLAQLRRDFTKDGKVIYMEKVVEQLRGGKEEDNVKRAYALLALSWIIRARGHMTLSFLNLVQDVSGLKKKKWATYAIENLVEGIKTLKKGKGKDEKFIGGCTIFLQLFAERMIPKENLPFECVDKRRKRKRDEDCNDSPEITESCYLDAKETLHEQVEEIKVTLQKKGKKNHVRYKNNPVKRNAAAAFLSLLGEHADDIEADFPKTYEEFVAARKRKKSE